MEPQATRVATRWANTEHVRSIALMKFLADVSRRLGVAEHVYVVGGAVRNWIMEKPIKDIDVVVDSVSLGKGRDSAWFAEQVQRAVPASVDLTTNQYGVAILTVKGSWVLDGQDLRGEVIEIANARKESYAGAGGKGKGYKPDEVVPATITEDVNRREFTFNTLLWRMLDLAEGPDKAEIIDLTGVGRQHLREKLIQTPLDPDRTFSDDPTRMLRAIKFIVRYDLQLSSEVESSIQRNAHRLHDMPWEAVGKLVVDDILRKPGARLVLGLMDDLGLIRVVGEMLQRQKPFAAYLTRQLRENPNVELLLDLLDRGFGSTTSLTFLTPEQHLLLRFNIRGLSPQEAADYVDALRTPPIDNMAIIEELKLEPRDRGKIAPVARELLLKKPGLVSSPEALTRDVLAILR
jgi:tRNA nucleotidyltransferase/poly(A) polymerase